MLFISYPSCLYCCSCHSHQNYLRHKVSYEPCVYYSTFLYQNYVSLLSVGKTAKNRWLSPFQLPVEEFSFIVYSLDVSWTTPPMHRILNLRVHPVVTFLSLPIKTHVYCSHLIAEWMPICIQSHCRPKSDVSGKGAFECGLNLTGILFVVPKLHWLYVTLSMTCVVVACFPDYRQIQCKKKNQVG